MSESIQPPFEAYYGEEPYIFISYAHKDAAEVYPEIHRLHDAGYKIWYDEGIDPGNEWPEEIAKALDGCTLFLSFVSQRSADSINCRNEVNYALNNKKMFLAIYLEETTLPGGLALRMGDLQAIMKFRMDDESYARKMEKALKGYLGDVGQKPMEGISAPVPKTEKTSEPPKASPEPKSISKLPIFAAVAIAVLLAYFFIPNEPTEKDESPQSPPNLTEIPEPNGAEQGEYTLNGVGVGKTKSEILRILEEQAKEDSWTSKAIRYLFLPLPEESSPQLKSKAQALESQLQASGFPLVEREQLESIMKEQQLSQSMLADSSARLRLGKLVSARVFLEPVVIGEGDSASLSLKAFDSESSETFFMGQLKVGEAPNAIVEGLRTKTSERFKIQGKVISIDEMESMVYVNIGKFHSVQNGDVFMVMRQGDPIKNGDVILGYKKTKIGKITISGAEDRFSLIKNSEKLEIKEGDLLIKI